MAHEFSSNPAKKFAAKEAASACSLALLHRELSTVLYLYMIFLKQCQL